MSAGQPCASCESQIPEVGVKVVLTEGGDVLCVSCGTEFLKYFPEEGQWKDDLEDVHEDWRV